MFWFAVATAAPVVVTYREKDSRVIVETSLPARADRAEETVELRPGVSLACEVRGRRATVQVSSEAPLGALPEAARCAGLELSFRVAGPDWTLAGALAGSTPVQVRQGGTAQVVVTNEPGWGEVDGAVDAAGVTCRSQGADHFDVRVAAAPEATTGPAVCTIVDGSGTSRTLHLFVGFADPGSKASQETVIHTTAPR